MVFLLHYVNMMNYTDFPMLSHSKIWKETQLNYNMLSSLYVAGFNLIIFFQGFLNLFFRYRALISFSVMCLSGWYLGCNVLMKKVVESILSSIF